MRAIIFALSAFVLPLYGCSNDDPSTVTRSEQPSQTQYESLPPVTEAKETLPEGEVIPRSMYENAVYYLIKVEPDGQYLRALHSRVSKLSHGYSVTRIDCTSNRYQDLGYGQDQQSNIKMYDSVNWTDVLLGSSKSDLVVFVCNNK